MVQYNMSDKFTNTDSNIFVEGKPLNDYVMEKLLMYVI